MQDLPESSSSTPLDDLPRVHEKNPIHAMTLQELKKRATASELTLIEAVEESLYEEIVEEVKQKAFCFIEKNLPPDRETIQFSPESAKNWGRDFKEALNSVEP